MRSLKLAHRYTEFVAGATLILLGLNDGISLNEIKYKRLNSKEELAIDTTHEPP
jgi:hypothetical protein